MFKHNCRILLVEDHPFQLKATLYLLETYGFTHITTADNAANALQQMQLAIHPFELLLCDQHLPDYPGLELIQIAHRGGVDQVRHTPELPRDNRTRGVEENSPCPAPASTGLLAKTPETF